MEQGIRPSLLGFPLGRRRRGDSSVDVTPPAGASENFDLSPPSSSPGLANSPDGSEVAILSSVLSGSSLSRAVNSQNQSQAFYPTPTSPSFLAQRITRMRSPNSALAVENQRYRPPDISMSSTPSSRQHKIRYKIRFVPHLGRIRSLHFEPVVRKCKAGEILRIGRMVESNPYFDASDLLGVVRDDARPDKVAFRSKVVSRHHGQIWVDQSGQFWIKDTKSSSGTFVNRTRLSPPNQESTPYAIRDGDVIQLGVDYQGGVEDIYRSVRFSVQISSGEHDLQNSSGAFNSTALHMIKLFQRLAEGHKQERLPEENSCEDGESTADREELLESAGECCICLFSMRVRQALFVAPCSHAFHYKCIRPLVELHHPGFSCPMCRNFADLDMGVHDNETNDPHHIENLVPSQSRPHFNPGAASLVRDTEHYVSGPSTRRASVEIDTAPDSVGFMATPLRSART